MLKYLFWILVLIIVPVLCMGASTDYKVANDGTVYGYDFIAKSGSTYRYGARPEWFGTGTTAIASAVAATYNVTKGTYGRVIIGSDQTITSTLDLSVKPGLTLDFQNGARFTCQTGATSACINVVGSNDLTLNNPNLYMPTTGYSSIGILGGYNNTGSSGQFHTRIINPKITWQTWTTCPSANSSMGVVGIAMIGGENIDINNSNIQANIPILLSSIPTVAWLEGTASAFDFRTVDSKLPASWTQGHVSLSGKQVLQAMGKHRASLEMYNVNNVTMEAGYTGSPAADPATDGAYLVGIHQTTGQNNKLHWLAEGQDTALRMVTDYNSTFDYQIASPASAKPSTVLYGGGGFVENSTLNALPSATNSYSFGIDTTSPFTGTFTGNVWRSKQGDAAKVWDASFAVIIPTGLNVVSGSNVAWNTRDFRTGTVTAGLTAGTSGTITLSDASLMYTTYGSEVAIRGMLIVNSVSSPVGELTLTGLPLAVGAGNKNYAPIAIYANDMNATATTTLFGYAVPGASTMVIKHFAAGTAANAAADIKAGTVLMINGTYSQ